MAEQHYSLHFKHLLSSHSVEPHSNIIQVTVEWMVAEEQLQDIKETSLHEKILIFSSDCCILRGQEATICYRTGELKQICARTLF